mgnify:CR=1 FL=1
MLIDLQQPASATIRTSHTDNQMKQIIKVHMPEATSRKSGYILGSSMLKNSPGQMSVEFESILGFLFDDMCM